MPIKLHCKSVLCGLISPTSAPLYNLQLGRGYIGDDSLEATVTNAIVQDPPRPRSRFSLPSLSLSISISPLPPFLSIRRPPPYVQNFPPRGGEDLSSRCVGSRSSPRVWKGLENLVCSRETTIVHPRLRKWVIIGSCLWRLRHGNCLCIKQIPDRYSAVGWADQIVRVCRGYPQNSIAIMTPDRSIEFRVFFYRDEPCLHRRGKKFMLLFFERNRLNKPIRTRRWTLLFDLCKSYAFKKKEEALFPVLARSISKT